MAFLLHGGSERKSNSVFLTWLWLIYVIDENNVFLLYISSVGNILTILLQLATLVNCFTYSWPNNCINCFYLTKC